MNERIGANQVRSDGRSEPLQRVPVQENLANLARGPMTSGPVSRQNEQRHVAEAGPLPPGFSLTEGYATVADLCRGEGLEALALPPELQGGMRRVGMNTFGTRPAERSLYEQEPWVAEALARREAPFAMFGFAGGGMASRTLNCVLVNNEVALFCQISMDFIPAPQGVVRDQELVHRHVSSWLKGINGFVASVADAKARGVWPAGQRLFVVHSDHAPERARQGWVADGAPGNWTPEELPGFMDALSAVRRLGVQEES